jgi:hypothetical protein
MHPEEREPVAPGVRSGRAIANRHRRVEVVVTRHEELRSERDDGRRIERRCPHVEYIVRRCRKGE